jgi:hypothetical protein
MFGAIDPVLVVKDLVWPAFPFKANEVDGLDPRPRPDSGGRVEPFDANLFREEIQLRRHGGGC